MAWYRTGTISVENGSKAISGVGTAFVKNVVAGFGLLGPDLAIYEIESIASDTEATLKTPYAGATVSGSAYAIFQTQGMIAELSRQVAELLATFGALRDGFIDGVLKLSAGGTGATDAATARANLGLADAYLKSNILGAVSQSGGVPTGAIIERGSNSNGEYVRYADGTQICWTKMEASGGINIANGVLFRTPDTAWTYPSVFAAGTVPAVSTAVVGGAAVSWSALGGVSATRTGTTFVGYGTASSGAVPVIALTAVGRWF